MVTFLIVLLVSFVASVVYAIVTSEPFHKGLQIVYAAVAAIVVALALRALFVPNFWVVFTALVVPIVFMVIDSFYENKRSARWASLMVSLLIGYYLIVPTIERVFPSIVNAVYERVAFLDGKLGRTVAPAPIEILDPLVEELLDEDLKRQANDVLDALREEIHSGDSSDESQRRKEKLIEKYREIIEENNKLRAMTEGKSEESREPTQAATPSPPDRGSQVDRPTKTNTPTLEEPEALATSSHVLGSYVLSPPPETPRVALAVAARITGNDASLATVLAERVATELSRSGREATASIFAPGFSTSTAFDMAFMGHDNPWKGLGLEKQCPFGKDA